MSHHIYQTEGFVLGSNDFGESNRLFYIFTKDLGLINMSAQGVREIKSKLKYSLQDFCHIKINAVKSRSFWRITNTESIRGYNLGVNNKEKTIIMAHIFMLLRRLLHGEDRNKELFDVIFQFMRFIKSNNLTNKELKSLEIITNLQILYHLGYGTNEEKLALFLDCEINENSLHNISLLERVALAEINTAIRESQL